MPRPRPTALTVIAILNLVFGGLGLVCFGISGVMQLTGGQRALTRLGTPEQQAQQQRQQFRHEIEQQVNEQRVPLYRLYSRTNAVLNTLFSLALVASGIGLLCLQPWARWVAVGYACLSILLQVVVIVYTVAWMLPAEQEVMRRMPPQNDQERMAYNIAQVAAPGCPCGMMLYPGAVLLVMLLPSTGEAFRPPRRQPPRRPRRRAEDEEDTDEDDPDDQADEDYPRRRRRR